MSTISNLSREEKLDLYTKCKDLYYNGGDSPLSDLEFDELEMELGLENQGYVGTHHQKSYTVRHPYLMGSLSKVQIKEDENHNVDWKKYSGQVMSYLDKSRKDYGPEWYFEVSRKYDGCSFEVVINSEGELVSVSTRGDGKYGKDIKVWFEDEWKESFAGRLGCLGEFKDMKYFIVRGECLVHRFIFNMKYSSDFTMPRSFVAGVIGQDWDGTYMQKEMRKDLSWVCYDYRVLYNNGTLEELDYIGRDDFPGMKAKPGVHIQLDLKNIYETYDMFRKESDFDLDGFVIKPGAKFRLQDGDRARQEDCVAVKFLPEIVDAVIKDIEWNVGKTGEYFPTGILEDVILGGKNVNRVSLANYGKVVEEGLGSGARVKVSLAGDIIPYLYKVVSKSDVITLPEDSYADGVHLMKRMSINEKRYIKFLNSVNVLKPDGIGEAVTKKLFDLYDTDELYETDNIMDLMIDIDKVAELLDDSKSSQNIVNSLKERKKTLTLPDIIQSMGYEACGEKNSLWLAKRLSGLNPDIKGIPMTVLDLTDDYYFQDQVVYYMNLLGIKYLKEEKTDGRIPVILTGSPKECGYATKAEFLNAHSNLIETTKFDECQILITDSLNSTSSKMEKAKKKGIQIKTYLNF